ncbi:uncharacterized protein [Littorina saxatilis]|uniref:uncharacterized protein isoform X2 n=1 Tax=Littorina saxatilis TaxID=31220 RepID=UPI0038B4C3C3
MTRTMTQIRVLVVFYGCAIFALLFQGTAPFQEKTAHACHSLSDCGHAQLTCNADQRLAILRVSHGHHLNLSNFDQCPSSVENCSAVADVCCRPPIETSLRCLEDYPLESEVLMEAHQNCSASLSRSSDYVTCDLELPPSPQQAKGRCSNVTIQENIIVFQNLSSYSTVDYACVNESDVVQLCTASKKSGNLLYTLWDSGQALPDASDANMTTCQCSVTSASASQVFIRALDVRIPQTDVSQGCSYVTVTDSGRTWLNTSCLTDTSIYFHTSSQTTRVTTPIDVIMSLNTKHLPDIVWLGFTSLRENELTLTCYEAGAIIRPLEKPSTQPSNADGNGDSSFPVAATVGASVAVIVILVIGGFVCFHFFNKRKSSSGVTKPKGQSWWERTREQDRIAELSQLGLASKVIIDSGRHMQYGKHPTYRRHYPTGDNNPPIYFVPGSAFGRDPAAAEAETNIDFDQLSQQRTMPVYQHSENGSVRGRPLEPRVMFSPSTGPDQVVILSGEQPPPLRRYNIPPLTIREIE